MRASTVPIPSRGRAETRTSSSQFTIDVNSMNSNATTVYMNPQVETDWTLVHACANARWFPARPHAGAD